MKKSIVFSIHIGFWIAYFLLLTLFIAAATQGFKTGPNLSTLIKYSIYLVVIPSFSVFYLFSFLLFPISLNRKKIVKSILYALFYIFISVFIGLIFMSFENEFEMGSFRILLPKFIFMLVITIIIGIVSIVLNGFISWIDEFKSSELLQKKNHQIELELVKSQLDPHFLFNTINNIDVLILRDPEIASIYLNKLSDILRFMLFDSKTTKITLAEELAFIKKYIDLQKIRTSNLNYVDLRIEGNIEFKRIAPMVLTPFIENAFKHVDSKKTRNAINILIKAQENEILFECENSFSENKSKKIANSGLGNDLIQKRIELLYGNNHTFAVTNSNNSYKVKLILSHD